MPGPQRRKKQHKEVNHLRSSFRTRNRKKDLDEIDDDMKYENAAKLLKQDIDVDKPGKGQFYCLHCARYFIEESVLKEHFKTKVHKRRLKALELEPYSIEESERAGGLGSFKTAKKRKIETQPSNIDDIGKTSDTEDIAD